MNEFKATAQGLNYMIQSQPHSIPMGRVHRWYGTEKQLTPIAGQVRLDTETGQLVFILRFIYEETKDGETICLWHVRDLLTERRYRLDERKLGRDFNEMEVLAWAAR